MTWNPGTRQGAGPQSVAGPELPDEREEWTDATPEAPDPLMVKARRYIEADMADVDVRATASLDAKIRACLVLGLRGKSPSLIG
jgi:hypothetical protein